MSIILNKDLNIIRDLAKKQVEIANSKKMQDLIKEWRLHGNFDSGSRPMVTIELWTFKNDIIPNLLKCESEEGRKFEELLLMNLVNHTLFDDDTIVNDYQPFSYQGYFVPFNLEVKKTYAEGIVNEGLGHHFHSYVNDLKQDFHKLKKSKFGLIPKGETIKQMNNFNEIVGDILPAKIVGSTLSFGITMAIVHIMELTTILMSLYDYPELFHKMMDMVTDDIVEYFYLLEESGYLLPTVEEIRVPQGSYAFTNKLPSDKTSCRLSDIWLYSDSQETSEISPRMYEEFMHPYYSKFSKLFGQLSYGCCEPVDPIWENCISKYDNLGKVSISPWCNEEYMGEHLSGKEITYLRKPDPTLIGVNSILDEEMVRKHMDKTVNAAKGCTLEIVQRDVYCINNTPDKVRRYVELIRQSCEKHVK